MRAVSVPLKAAKSDHVHTLDFVERVLLHTQKRFENRSVLEPDIDLRRFRCKAVIDWADLQVETGRPTQWIWIQHYVEKALGQKLFVAPETVIDDGARTKFVIRIQQPQLRDFEAIVSAIDKRWGLESLPIIVGLEVSVDFYPRTPSPQDLALMFGILVRCHLPSRDVITRPEDRPRFAIGRGRGSAQHVLAFSKKRPERNNDLLIINEKDRPAPFDGTYYVGEEGSACSWRTMIKVIDAQNRATGTQRELPEEEQRVRIEVTLDRVSLAELGISEIKDLVAFKFQQLQGAFFSFYAPTFQVESAETAPTAAEVISLSLQAERRQKFLKAGVLGLQAMDDALDRRAAAVRLHARKSDRRLSGAKRVGKGSTRLLLAHKPLNLLVAHALRHLGARFDNSGG